MKNYRALNKDYSNKNEVRTLTTNKKPLIPTIITSFRRECIHPIVNKLGDIIYRRLGGGGHKTLQTNATKDNLFKDVNKRIKVSIHPNSITVIKNRNNKHTIVNTYEYYKYYKCFNYKPFKF